MQARCRPLHRIVKQNGDKTSGRNFNINPLRTELLEIYICIFYHVLPLK